MRYELLVLLWCYLTFVSSAWNQPPLLPQSDLAIALDYSLATTFKPIKRTGAPNNVIWSSHITFNNPVSEISAGQLWSLAIDAYGYIEKDLAQYNLHPRKHPNALTVLAWGNEIILASGQKGSDSFTYARPTSEVTKSLEVCQTTYLQLRPNAEPTGHRLEGKCGEQMAVHLYYLSPTGKRTKLQDQKAKIGTVVYDNNMGKPVPRKPCGGEGETLYALGCSLFVNDQKLEKLDIRTKPESYDLRTLAGGVVKKDQIQLCGTVRDFPN